MSSAAPGHHDVIHMAGPWVTEHEIKVVTDCMRNGWYNYDYVERLQREFAAYHGRKYALMTPNCTTAIHLLLTVMGIKEGDEVIAPECTWVGSVAGAEYLRAKLVLADIDPVHWCLDPASVERAITSRTRAIIVVDLFGNMPLMAELEHVARRHGIPLIEDAAEALGSTYAGRRAGSFGIGSVFSFHRTKTLATGEGGMLLLDDQRLWEEASMWRDHGRRPGSPAYVNERITYKYMPFNLQAAMGYAQFQRLDELVQRKRAIYERYRRNLADVPDLAWNAEPVNGFNSVWITGLVFGRNHGVTKADAMAGLQKMGLPSRPFFYPLSSLPAFPGREAHGRRTNPVAYDISSRGINLPGALILTDEQVDRVSAGVRRLLGY